jgi:N-acetylneuraminate lyase
MLDIKGIIPALISPCDREGNLDLAPLPKVLKFDLERGITGVFVGGSTGEGFCQTTEERKSLADTVVQEIAGRIPVIIHVGSMRYREVMELSEHAKDISADAVSAVIPFYYTFTLEETRNYYQAIAHASGLPTIVYALSHVAGSTFPPEEFMDAMLSVEGIYGIKFTNPDIYRLQTLKQLSRGKVRFYGGVDVLPLPMLSMGAYGLIGSNYSALPEPWVAIYNAFQAKDLEKAISMQERIAYYIRSFKHISGAQRVKWILRARGIDVGEAWLPKQPQKPEEERMCLQILNEFFADPVFKDCMRK